MTLSDQETDRPKNSEWSPSNFI